MSAEDLRPYLGEAGNVPRYELTDAIDRGEAGRAPCVLHRMLDAGGLVPVQVLATLHGHFANMLALDGEDVHGERDAGAAARDRSLRGQEGARAVAPSGERPHRRGHQLSSRRPTSTSGARAACAPRRWSRSWWPGWPARPGPASRPDPGPGPGVRTVRPTRRPGAGQGDLLRRTRFGGVQAAAEEL